MPKICCFSKHFVNRFTFSALHSVNGFSNEQQILNLMERGKPSILNEDTEPIRTALKMVTGSTCTTSAENKGMKATLGKFFEMFSEVRDNKQASTAVVIFTQRVFKGKFFDQIFLRFLKPFNSLIYTV